MSNYAVDQCYDFPVNKAVDVNEDFFRILVDGSTEVRLPKFLYQRGKALPSTVFCRVKMLRDGVPVLSHVPAVHVFKLYGERDWRHESYDFRVSRLPQSVDGPYELTDANGILFRLYDREARLVLGQKVRCRFERLTERGFMIVRDYDEDSLQFLPLDDILGATSLSPAMERFLRRFFAGLPELSTARACLLSTEPRPRHKGG